MKRIYVLDPISLLYIREMTFKVDVLLPKVNTMSFWLRVLYRQNQICFELLHNLRKQYAGKEDYGI